MADASLAIGDSPLQDAGKHIPSSVYADKDEEEAQEPVQQAKKKV